MAVAAPARDRPGHDAVDERDTAPRSWLAAHADLPFIAIALASGLALVYLGRSTTFLDDEWRSITFSGGAVDYLRPVNQHWSTVPLLMYRATLGVVGLRSYIPYLGEVILLHLLAVGGAYALMRRRVGPSVATLCALPLLLLGAGAENLFWAFQTGFVASVMFGLWALFFVEREGPRAPLVSSLLLVASLMSSAMGLCLLVVVAGRAILDARLRPRALVAAFPFVLYVVWLGLVGRQPLEGGRVFIEPGLGAFVARGVIYSTESVAGFGRLPGSHLVGLALFVVIAAVVAVRFVRGRPEPLAAGCLLGIVAMYSLIALTRLHADPGYDHSTASRFVYVAGFLLILAVVDVIPDLGRWRLRDPKSAGVLVVFVVVLGWVTVANVAELEAKRSAFEARAEYTRAFVGLALDRGHEPWVDRSAPTGWMPSVAELERTVARYGSPLKDELFPGVVKPPDATANEEALLALAGDGFRIEAARPHALFVPVHVGAGVSRVGRCAQAGLAPSEALWVSGLAALDRVRISSPAMLAARLFLAHDGGPSRRLYPILEPGSAQDVVLPDVGDERPWNLGLDGPSSRAVVRVCVELTGNAPTLRAPTVVVRSWDT